MASTRPRPQGSAETARTILHTRLEDESMVRETYEFGKKLGQGSFGVVLEALNVKTNQLWAVKIISKDIKDKVTFSQPNENSFSSWFLQPSKVW